MIKVIIDGKRKERNMGDIINGVASEYEMPKQPMFYENGNWKVGVLAPLTPQIKTVENSDKDKFETEVNELLTNGYKILNSSCGILYQAILIMR